MLTYYLGAGASANTMPLVKSFFSDSFSDYIKEQLFQNSLKKTIEINSDANEFYKKCLNLLVDSKKYWSIDTMAKVNRNNQLDSLLLKRLMTAYLLNHEFAEGIDNRYILLLQSLIEKRKEYYYVRNSVNFVSWNYDIQIERSVLNPVNGVGYIELSKALSVNEFKENYAFNLFKLNGSIFDFSDIYEHDYGALENHFMSGKIDYPKILEVVKGTRLIKNNTGIKFAWESEPEKNQVIANAIQAISRTTKLVIVGYSFPDFNADVDHLILSHLSKGTQIYIQCSNNERNINETVQQRVIEHTPNHISRADIHLIPTADRFFKPYVQEERIRLDLAAPF